MTIQASRVKGAKQCKITTPESRSILIINKPDLFIFILFIQSSALLIKLPIINNYWNQIFLSDCPAPGRKNGPTQLDPQDHEYFPLPVPRASYELATLQCPDTQLRSYTIRVWLNETFIVCKTVIDRYLAVET
jgi:hypothetical protein